MRSIHNGGMLAVCQPTVARFVPVVGVRRLSAALLFDDADALRQLRARLGGRFFAFGFVGRFVRFCLLYGLRFSCGPIRFDFRFGGFGGLCDEGEHGTAAALHLVVFHGYEPTLHETM